MLATISTALIEHVAVYCHTDDVADRTGSGRAARDMATPTLSEGRRDAQFFCPRRPDASALRGRQSWPPHAKSEAKARTPHRSLSRLKSDHIMLHVVPHR